MNALAALPAIPVLALVLALAPSSGVPAFAQRPAAAAPATCDPTRATQATVAAVAADPESWMGKCVTVKGVYSDERLYATAADARAKAASIGGYVNLSVYAEGVWRGEFTGRVSDCEQAQNDLDVGLLRSPGISLMGRVLGCLEAKGPFLVFMSQGKLTRAQ